MGERAVIYVSMPFKNISENVLIGLLAKFLAMYYELGLGTIQLLVKPSPNFPGVYVITATSLQITFGASPR